MAKKLIALIKGGLGNQLFAYAAARRLAYSNDATLVIDDVSGFEKDHLYQRSYSLDHFNIQFRKANYWERSEPFGGIRRGLSKRLNAYLPIDRRRYIIQAGVHFDDQILRLHLQEGTTYFEGFGQSEDYFRDIEELVRKDLVISEPLDDMNQSLASLIDGADAVALHIRWFDAFEVESKNNMALDYYLNAIEHIKKSIQDPVFFIFSDQIEVTKKILMPHFGRLQFHFVDNNQTSKMAYADLWLMSKCKHFIIANSTFSWWAAWLGEKQGLSKVFAPGALIDPQTSVTAWGFNGLLPKRWTVL
jgi:Glycosyl transferase family 11